MLMLNNKKGLNALSVLLVLLLCAGLALGLTSNPVYAAASPYANSTVITGLSWDTGSISTNSNDSDIWPLTWGADGSIYTAWGDGTGFPGGITAKQTWGLGKITSASPSVSGTDVYGPDAGESGQGKLLGLLAANNVIYAFANEQNRFSGYSGNHYKTRLYYSTNSGGTGWNRDDGPLWDEGEIRPYGFVNFGQNYSGLPSAAGNYVYAIGFKENDTGKVYMMRVSNSDASIKNKSSYSYYAGISGGNPVWSTAANAQPIFYDPSCTAPWREGYATIIYNPGLSRYILAVAHGHSGQIGIFEAPNPWGYNSGDKWRTIYYSDNWLGFTAGEYLGIEFPQKWISGDGKTMWAVFSVYNSTPSTYNDKIALIKATLTTGSGTPVLSENFNDGVADNFTTNGGTWNVGGGIYHQTGTSGRMMSYYANGTAWTNYTYTGSVKKLGTETVGTAGIAFRVQNGTSYYVFRWDANKTSDVDWGKVVNGTWTRIAYLNNYARTAGSSYDLKVVANGSNFTFYINGTQVGTGSDTQFSSGSVGFYAFDSAGDFDNVLVTQ